MLNHSILISQNRPIFCDVRKFCNIRNFCDIIRNVAKTLDQLEGLTQPLIQSIAEKNINNFEEHVTKICQIAKDMSFCKSSTLSIRDLLVQAFKDKISDKQVDFSNILAKIDSLSKKHVALNQKMKESVNGVFSSYACLYENGKKIPRLLKNITNQINSINIP